MPRQTSLHQYNLRSRKRTLSGGVGKIGVRARPSAPQVSVPDVGGSLAGTGTSSGRDMTEGFARDALLDIVERIDNPSSGLSRRLSRHPYSGMHTWPVIHLFIDTFRVCC